MTFKSILFFSCCVSLTSTAFSGEIEKKGSAKPAVQIGNGPVSAIDKPVWETIDSEFCLENGTQATYAKHVNGGRRIIFSSGGNMQEHSNEARKNALAAIYTGFNEHNWLVVAQNATWGDYCGYDGTWVTGKVYHSTFPHPNPVYNEYVTASSGITGSYNDYVTYFNNNRQPGQPAMDVCNFQKCPKWSDGNKGDKGDKGGKGGGSLSDKLDKLQSKALKKHKDLNVESFGDKNDPVSTYSTTINKKSD